MITLEPIEMISIGSMLVLGALVMGYSSIRLFVMSRRTAGAIVRLNSTASNMDGNTKRIYTPVVEYVVGGEKFIHVSSVYSDEYAGSVGQKIPVCYCLGNPSYVYVGKKAGFMYFELGLLILGLPLIFAGCVNCSIGRLGRL